MRDYLESGREYYDSLPLSDILRETEEPSRVIDGRDYRWDRLSFARDIRQHHEARERVGRVVIREYNPSVLGYGESYVSTMEAWMYADGTVLVASTIEEWAGTFASHNNIAVHFFALHPLTDAEKRERDNPNRRRY